MISDDEDQDMAEVSYSQKDDEEEEAADAVSHSTNFSKVIKIVKNNESRVIWQQYILDIKRIS